MYATYRFARIHEPTNSRTMTWAEASSNPLYAECLMTTIRMSESSRILTDPIGPTNTLVLDSGCTDHMFNSCRQLTRFSRIDDANKTVTVANGSRVPVLGWGRFGILRLKVQTSKANPTVFHSSGNSIKG